MANHRGGTRGMNKSRTGFPPMAAGPPISFSFALLTIIVWAATGPLFGYSDTWQLVINTGTTIVTFLMVFLIQKTQNRDTQAMHPSWMN